MNPNHTPNLMSLRSILILSSHLCQVFSVVSSLQGSSYLHTDISGSYNLILVNSSGALESAEIQLHKHSFKLWCTFFFSSEQTLQLGMIFLFLKLHLVLYSFVKSACYIFHIHKIRIYLFQIFIFYKQELNTHINYIFQISFMIVFWGL
jgi:hypothetical protein